MTLMSDDDGRDHYEAADEDNDLLSGIMKTKKVKKTDGRVNKVFHNYKLI